MKNERLVHAIGKINDDLIYNAANDVKAREKGGWLKWGAVAACLCAAVAVVFIFFGPAATDSLDTDNDEGKISSDACYPAMVMINGELYHDSGDITFPDSAREDGKIISSGDEVPTDNDQSNFGTGYSYQYGEDNTIIVQLDDGWHIFIPVAGSDGSNRHMDGLSEQEKMEIDPYYNADRYKGIRLPENEWER